MHLQDVQELLDKPDRINQILALGCNCADSSLPFIREQLAEALPGTRITEHQSIALARAEQRKAVSLEQAGILQGMVQNIRDREEIVEERKVVLAEMTESRARIDRIMVTLADVITPLVVLVCAIWVGLLALANVRQRSTEIGLLRALGKGSGMIAGLFLGKAVLVGMIGAAAGFLLGTGMAQFLGQSTLDVASGYFAPRIDILIYAMVGAPLLSALASYLPTLFALIQDPAVVLRET
jgi:putative ABC transport system permease protein